MTLNKMTVIKLNQTSQPEELKILTSRAIPIDDVTLIKDLVQDLIETAESLSNCVGLSANQIWKGDQTKIPAVSIVLSWEESAEHNEPPDKWKVLVNPSGKGSGPNIKYWEICMSSRHKKPKIKKRKKNYTLTYYDMSMLPRTIKMTGVLAQLIQHELDHLKGETLWRE